MSIKKFKVNGLTRRWVFNVLSVILLVLVVIELTFVFIVKDYYDSSVERFLKRQSETVTVFISNYSSENTNDFLKGSKEYVESFDSHDKMEVQILDSDGSIIMSTNGMAPDAEIDDSDFKNALASPDLNCTQKSRSSAGESVMTSVSIIKDKNHSTYVLGAIRILVSVEVINTQFALLVVITTAICFILFAVVFLSGLYFIRSIINPVRNISETARQIAMGDFEARINEGYKQDEVGQLCDVINYMAGELGSTEKLKNEFISSVSHELRTPLTAIKGWGETIAQNPEDAELTKKGMDVILGESERLSVIVEDLLDFSRLQNGQMSYNMQICDLMAELSEAVLSLTHTAARLDITIDYNEPDYAIPTITGDPVRLQQVFVNILDNAMKYTDAGGSIIVSIELINENIVTMISDNGKGIPADDLANIKQKFFKAKNSVRGSGIGLAVADEIVTYHGGKLEINSTEGVGTSVNISIPVSTAVPEE